MTRFAIRKKVRDWWKKLRRPRLGHAGAQPEESSEEQQEQHQAQEQQQEAEHAAYLQSLPIVVRLNVDLERQQPILEQQMGQLGLTVGNFRVVRFAQDGQLHVREGPEIRL